MPESVQKHSQPHKQISLSQGDEARLDALADRNKFWASVRAAYADFGTLTQRQYELLHEQVSRDAWRANAPIVDGVAARNQFATAEGRPRCANRAKPYCREEATQVVGSFAYCPAHVMEARAAYDEWLREKKSEHDGDGGKEDEA
ncbi:MAG: hypothetical protein DLM50_08395 [Candidatus Meridianibacter frigidus]|nr:MAG: hypothetical protein DLM50_08395 [Candidatus Eremiobacteraeota bacterium]